MTEDDDQMKKANQHHKHILQQHFQQQQQQMIENNFINNSSDISSNCSSVSISNQLLKATSSATSNQIDQHNNKETNSLTDVHSYRVSVTNSDPVVVDNSISSTNTTKSDCSQIYGYNLANLVINKEKPSFSYDGTKHQQHKYKNSQKPKLAVTESFSDRDTYESDYSTTTPSKNKKVVYEVIV